MSEESNRCIAKTQAGTRCKNKAHPGSDYCHLHGNAKTAPTPVDDEPTSDSSDQASASTTPAAGSSSAAANSRANQHLELLLEELNALAAELQRLTPEFKPPPFAPKRLRDLLGEMADKYAPETQMALLRDLQSNLSEATAKDLVDPEMWKGLWYILNYSLQYQASALLQSITAKLASLPGVALLNDLRGNLEGTTARDLLDVETWRGLAYVLTYTAQMQVTETRRRVFGGEDDVEEITVEVSDESGEAVAEAAEDVSAEKEEE